MKKLVCIVLATILLLALAGCAQKTLHCDGCGTEVKVSQSSNMTEDWIIFCDSCDDDLPNME